MRKVTLNDSCNIQEQDDPCSGITHKSMKQPISFFRKVGIDFLRQYLTPCPGKRTDGFILGCKIIGIRDIQIMHALTEIGMDIL